MSQPFLHPLSPTFTDKRTIQKFIECPNILNQASIYSHQTKHPKNYSSKCPISPCPKASKQNTRSPNETLKNLSRMSQCPQASKQVFSTNETPKKNLSNVPIFRTKQAYILTKQTIQKLLRQMSQCPQASKRTCSASKTHENVLSQMSHLSQLDKQCSQQAGHSKTHHKCPNVPEQANSFFLGAAQPTAVYINGF